MSKLRILSKRGDDEVHWDVDSPSLLKAQQVFNECLEAGHSAFAKTEDGHKRVTTFDPLADEIILVKPLVGG